VTVTLDGIVVGRGVVGSEYRPDVAQATGESALAETGWRMDVDTSGLDVGEAQQVSVHVWGDPWDPPLELARFAVVLTDESIEHPGPDFKGALEKPVADEPVGPVFFVSGWIVNRSDMVSRVDVLLDGQSVGQARLGLPRHDVGQDQAGDESWVSGFERWVDLSTRPDTGSDLTVQVMARTRSGPPTRVFERTVRVAPFARSSDPPESPAVVHQPWRRVVSPVDAPKSGHIDLAVFTHQIDYGGGQIWLDEFLDKSGAGTDYPCTVITYRDGPLREGMEHRGIAVHVTSAPPVDDIAQYEGRIAELTALVAAGGHNVVMLNTASLFSGAEVAKRLELPVVWGIHESLPPEVFLQVAFAGCVQPEVREKFIKSLGSADAIVFEAEATRQMYAPTTNDAHSLVVPYGVNTRAITEYCERVSRTDARADIGLPEELRVILVMGTIEPRKSQVTIAQALRLVRTDHRPWTMVFVGGSDSVYCDMLKRYLQENGLAERARVVPVDTDTYRWYRAADVLLSASDMESLPRSMLEAMCFGVPVVSTAVFGVPSLLGDGKYGILFEPNDLNATIGALNEVLSIEAESLHAMGDAAREHVLAYYDSAGYATDLMALCQGLLQSPELGPGEILTRWGRDSDQPLFRSDS
jgi:glycosyltransferase involved in cell wall biosynthesis